MAKIVLHIHDLGLGGAERIALKPKNPHTWRRYADALELAGDARAAKTARQQCSTLLAA